MDIEKVLFELGIYPNLKGFTYIPEALEYIRKGQEKVTAIYKLIADKYSTTDTRVERCIRHAFEQMDRNKPLAKEIFRDCKRSNGVLLFMMNYWLRKQEGGEHNADTNRTN